MSTSFLEIYKEAISRIDDPRLTNKFEESIIDFSMIMNNFLLDAMPKFTTPSFVLKKLMDHVDADMYSEDFKGDGIVIEFKFDIPIPDTAIVEVRVDGSVKTGYHIDYTNYSVVFDIAPMENSDIQIRWYEAGYFNSELNLSEINILSDILIYCWAQKERNYLLDIRRLLSDTDFKLNDASKSVEGKSNWVYGLREEYQKAMNNYSWQTRYKPFDDKLWRGIK